MSPERVSSHPALSGTSEPHAPCSCGHEGDLPAGEVAPADLQLHLPEHQLDWVHVRRVLGEREGQETSLLKEVSYGSRLVN